MLMVTRLNKKVLVFWFEISLITSKYCVRIVCVYHKTSLALRSTRTMPPINPEPWNECWIIIIFTGKKENLQLKILQKIITIFPWKMLISKHLILKQKKKEKKKNEFLRSLTFNQCNIEILPSIPGASAKSLLEKRNGEFRHVANGNIELWSIYQTLDLQITQFYYSIIWFVKSLRSR